MRYNDLLENFKKALENLRYAVENAEDDLHIDGAIKRFELCYGLASKTIKAYHLADLEIIDKNPRDCFKYANQNELINDYTVWMDMIEDRNILVHTYTFEESREIFEHLEEKYLKAFEFLYEKITECKEGDEQLPLDL